MTVLFDAEVHVHYGFIHVDSGVGGWDGKVEHRAGQRNGLLGAVQPGFLLILTGMHTGLVPLRVEAHEGAPPIDETFEEVVEASCDLRGPELTLSTFEWGTSIMMPQHGPHRVRLSARGYEAGRQQERYDQEEPVLDSYLLQLWPAAMAPDEVVRVTSPNADHLHGEGLGQPSPSPQDQALAEQHERDDAVAGRQTFERELHLLRWGGRDPSPRLLQVQDHAMALVPERRDLVDAIEALPPDRQRALAVDLAGRTCTADSGQLDWQPALDALAAGDPLPAPFDDEGSLHARLYPGSVTVMVVSSGTSLPSRQPLDSGITAAYTVRAAAAVDPLEAALRAVEAASWSAPDLDIYFADITATIAGG